MLAAMTKDKKWTVMIKIKHIFLAFLLNIFSFTSCSEIKTTDPVVAYKNWASTKPPSDIELYNGQYWQSAHLSKEYIMYLKFKPTKLWWNEFLKHNYISEDKYEWTMPNDAPSWFKPSENSVRYKGDEDYDQGSRYFRDSETGICFIYEIQL